MSRARHKKGRDDGGRVGLKAAGNPDVFKEAEGKESYANGGERKRGGKVKKHVGAPEGKKARHRHDRPGRKMGGRVGADRAPLSTAHKGGAAEEKAGGQPD
jgi:hypothetical protein